MGVKSPFPGGAGVATPKGKRGKEEKGREKGTDLFCLELG
jgi:hypothetical protein